MDDGTGDRRLLIDKPTPLTHECGAHVIALYDHEHGGYHPYCERCRCFVQTSELNSPGPFSVSR